MNFWVIIHCLSVSCKQINHSCFALVIWSPLQLTSKQWIITQQFTARADLLISDILCFYSVYIFFRSSDPVHDTLGLKKNWVKNTIFESSHEITVLFILCKLILQTHIRSHPVGLNVWLLVEPFVYFHTTCVRTAKALARLRGYAGSPEPLLVAYVVSTIISWAGSFMTHTFDFELCQS